MYEWEPAPTPVLYSRAVSDGAGSRDRRLEIKGVLALKRGEGKTELTIRNFSRLKSLPTITPAFVDPPNASQWLS
jgi:hypothetical protein